VVGALTPAARAGMTFQRHHTTPVGAAGAGFRFRFCSCKYCQALTVRFHASNYPPMSPCYVR
jgi:hypothetical protein